jgi:two-component system, LuxR family, sensor kinase FixL
MSWITIVWSMNAAACLTLAGIYLVVWCKQRDDWVHLLFSCSAVAAAAVAGFELAMLRTDTVGQYEALVRWIHVPVWVLTVCFVAFVRRYLRAGRTWLAWSIYGLRTVVLILNFILTPNINFLAITKVRHLSWWGGEIVSLPIGMPNPWGMLSLASLLLLLIFCIDATVTVWRRGDRRRALIVGGGMIFGTIVAWHVPLVILGVLNVPFFLCFAYSGIVLAMSYELSNDMLQTAHLARQLEASETDLREMKQRMELAASAAELGMWMWDIVRDEIWITDKGRALFGLPPSEKVDFNRFRNMLHPEDRESVLQVLENSLRTGAEYRSEYRAVLPNGQIRWIAGQGNVEFGGDGQPVRMRGCSLDITRRKQAELEAAHQRKDLAHLSRVTTLGELSGSIAHELTQPLSAILSNAQAAQRVLASGDADIAELRQILNEIVSEDKRASEVIRRLRLWLKKGEVQQHSLRINKVVREVLNLIRSDLINQKVNVKCKLARNLPTVTGDPVQLQQVLLNLVVNACDAMTGCSTSERRLLIRTGIENDGGSVIVSVTDQGTGITEEKMENIFEPFFTTKPKGMGLGLSVCRSIITAHRGKLCATNNTDRGATFYFSVPVEVSPVATPLPATLKVAAATEGGCRPTVGSDTAGAPRHGETAFTETDSNKELIPDT